MFPYFISINWWTFYKSVFFFKLWDSQEKGHKILIFVFSGMGTCLAHGRCTISDCSLRRPQYWVFLLAPECEYIIYLLLTTCLKLGMEFLRGINHTSVLTAIQRLCYSIGNSYSIFPFLQSHFAPSYLSFFPTWSQTFWAQKRAKGPYLIGVFILPGSCQDYFSLLFEVSLAIQKPLIGFGY